MRRKSQSHSAAGRYARLGRERRRRQLTPPVPEAPPAPGSEPAPPRPRLARPVAAATGSARTHDFSIEYTYLASDLRRIAVVAGGLLLAMIVGARLLT